MHLQCGGVSALFTFMCNSTDACNGLRNLNPPALASEGRSVTGRGHPRLVRPPTHQLHRNNCVIYALSVRLLT